MAGVQHITVGAHEGEQRLDRFLRRRFPELTQGWIEKRCRRGEIRIGSARARPASRVGPGDTVRVPPLPAGGRADGIATGATSKPDAALAAELAAELAGAVLFMDEALLVLAKPPGLAVQGGTGQRRHLAAALPGLRFGRPDDPRLVHRLDRDTSGVLVLARTGQAAVALGRMFRSRAVRKTYVAVVAGRPEPPAGTIRWGLVKAGARGEGERMRLVHPDAIDDTPGARPAVTRYRVIESAGKRASWVALRPVTGRTHQLRAHMAGLGCPVAGDGKYGGRGQENPGSGWGAGLGADLSRRLHLHAARLELPHPVSGAPLRLEAPLPAHMADTFAFFGWNVGRLPEEPFAAE